MFDDDDFFKGNGFSSSSFSSSSFGGGMGGTSKSVSQTTKTVYLFSYLAMARPLRPRKLR